MARKLFPRNCTKCGETFGSTGTTVRCPECRRPSDFVAPTTRTLKICRCGKTVLTAGVTCPRECHL